jgi:hypothetical protein
MYARGAFGADAESGHLQRAGTNRLGTQGEREYFIYMILSPSLRLECVNSSTRGNLSKPTFTRAPPRY